MLIDPIVSMDLAGIETMITSVRSTLASPEKRADGERAEMAIMSYGALKSVESQLPANLKALIQEIDVLMDAYGPEITALLSPEFMDALKAMSEGAQ